MVIDYVISLPKDNTVRCRFWEDECVAYHQVTGNTHLINGVGAELFKCLVRKVSTQHELLQYLQSSFDLPNNFDANIFLQQLISEYQTMGLLNITESCNA